ncbi:protein ZGRF1-like [Nycticebus coucang]|uniref:protein ZGRF1-like n=1 Tax=Nycticebus coucang TaxID=9470 RepID=UPI00234DFFC4|nr:protein ZGRF1-like [Nycticebus coucang]
MESKEFNVLYTHQKTKKSKVWQDGILKITHLGNKAILYDDKGSCLESIFLKCLEVKPGDDLEGDRYLISVEEIKVTGGLTIKKDVIKEAPELSSKRFVSSGRSLGCQPAGLKRKFTGFQGPCQVPKKMVITENYESPASLEAKKPGPTFSSPFYSTPSLFSTVGKKDINDTSTDPENVVTYKDKERNDIPFSLGVPAPSFKINTELLCEESYFCCPISSGSKHPDSLQTSEPRKGDNFLSPCLRVSQNIRSKAQILALLKSKSTSTSKKLDSKITEHFPPIQPQEALNIATKPKCLIHQEKYTEMKSTENLHCQHQSENTMRNKNQWAVYLSSQSSPVHSSVVGGSDSERKPKAQEDDINLNLKELLVQKRTQLFETYIEKGGKYNVEKPVKINDQFWNQEIKLEIPSFCDSNSLQITCSSAKNDGVSSESDIQENNRLSSNQNDKLYIKGSVLNREDAPREGNMCGTSEKGCKQLTSSLVESEHLPIESSLSSNSRISNDITDMFSKSNTDIESLNSIHESLSNVTQPFWEVNFDLNNFETSDTEEESQQSNKISQNSDSWIKEILVNNNNSCVQKEIGSEHLPLLTIAGGKPTETFPVKETVPLQFCNTTCVGFDPGPCKAENAGNEAGNARKEIEENSDTLNTFDSSLEWTNDVYIDNKEDSNKSIQKVRTNHDFALVPSKSKDISTNLHIPDFLNMATDQTHENNLFSEDAQSQPFILESDLDKSDEQVLPSTCRSDNSTQLLNINQNDSECITLDKSNVQISSSLFCPLGKEHLIFKDTEARIPESEDWGRIRSLSHDHVEVKTSGKSKQYWNNPRNASELSELVNNISLLKSLSEHSTALDSLEILKKENAILQQQGTQQIHEPDSSPEARKSFTTVVSQAIPKSSHLNQDSQQILKENEVERSEPPQSLQFFSLGNKEDTAFLDVIPKQIERKTYDHKVKFVKNIDFLTNNIFLSLFFHILGKLYYPGEVEILTSSRGQQRKPFEA